MRRSVSPRRTHTGPRGGTTPTSAAVDSTSGSARWACLSSSNQARTARALVSVTRTHVSPDFVSISTELDVISTLCASRIIGASTGPRDASSSRDRSVTLASGGVAWAARGGEGVDRGARSDVERCPPHAERVAPSSMTRSARRRSRARPSDAPPSVTREPCPLDLTGPRPSHSSRSSRPSHSSREQPWSTWAPRAPRCRRHPCGRSPGTRPLAQ